MRAFGHQAYVVSLHSRQGEFDAVERLHADVREVTIPLWEILSADAMANGEPATELEPAIGALSRKIHGASKGLEGFVDCGLLEPSRRMRNGEHPVTWLCRETQNEGTPLTPVVAVDSDADYVEAVKNVRATLGSDLGVRLTISDLGQIADVRNLITDLDIDFSALHLIVDCKSLDSSVAQILPTVLPPLINAVLKMGVWKSVTILSGAIPENYTAFSPGLTLLPRLEWSLWLALVPTGILQRRPTFGDYAIAHAVYSYTPPWMGISSAAKIRYTGLSEYHIFRGRSLKPAKYGKFAQFFTLAAQVANHPVYRGPGYSAGDQRIADCAAQNVGTGNLQTWVEVGVSQHVTFLARTVPLIP